MHMAHEELSIWTKWMYISFDRYIVHSSGTYIKSIYYISCTHPYGPISMDEYHGRISINGAVVVGGLPMVLQLVVYR